jgi:hypothetical protein
MTTPGNSSPTAGGRTANATKGIVHIAPDDAANETVGEYPSPLVRVAFMILLALGDEVEEAVALVVAHVELSFLEDARDNALATWNIAHAKWEKAIVPVAVECQARARFHALDAEVHRAKARLASMANEKAAADAGPAE